MYTLCIKINLTCIWNTASPFNLTLPAFLEYPAWGSITRNLGCCHGNCDDWSFQIVVFSVSIDLNIQGETHDSIEDARTALQLYRKYLELSRGGGSDEVRKVLKGLYEKGRQLDWKVPDSDTGDGQGRTAQHIISQRISVRWEVRLAVRPFYEKSGLNPFPSFNRRCCVSCCDGPVTCWMCCFRSTHLILICISICIMYRGIVVLYSLPQQEMLNQWPNSFTHSNFVFQNKSFKLNKLTLLYLFQIFFFQSWWLISW